MVTADVDVSRTRACRAFALRRQSGFACGSRRAWGTALSHEAPAETAAGLVVVIGGRGELQRLADRLDPESLPVSFDVGSYFGCRRSTSAPKKAVTRNSA